MLIGGHVSVAGGLYKGIENATRIGANAIQIFGASPQQWAAKMHSPADIKKYKDALKASEVKAVYLHGSYLVNLGSFDEMMRAKSVNNLTTHLKIVDAIDADGLIFHVGSGKRDISKEEAITHAVKGMKEVLKNVPGKSRLVIENAAGGGSKIGFDAKEIGEMMRMVDSDRVKVCYDTAHAFEAGIIEHYEPKIIKTFFDVWDKEVGMENIVALHVNDSKTEFNSRHDRHENLGEGYIGLQAFKNLAKEKRLHDKAWLLEVPGFDDMGPDKKNVDILKKCFKG